MSTVDMPQIRSKNSGNNSRNKSNDIFYDIKSPHSFHNPTERYQTDFASIERARYLSSRERYASQRERKIQWLRDIEGERWSRMHQQEKRKQERHEFLHSQSRVGQQSMAYNPITLQYHISNAGSKLQEKDLKSIHRTSVRATKLYFKSNTFDPIKGRDIVPDYHSKSLPDFPKTLIEATVKTGERLGAKLQAELPKSELVLGMTDIDCRSSQPIWALRS